MSLAGERGEAGQASSQDMQKFCKAPYSLLLHVAMLPPALALPAG